MSGGEIQFVKIATEAHFADGHAKGCSPACAVEVGYITDALRRVYAAGWASCAAAVAMEKLEG